MKGYRKHYTATIPASAFTLSLQKKYLQAAQVNLRVQKMVAVVAVLLLVVKIVAWRLTGSVSILTDALESIVNVAAGFISLYSLYIAAMPRDSNHPYGHGKAEFLSAAVEGSLISIAGIIIIYQSITGFIHPKPITQLNSGILIIAVTAVINFLVGSYCIKTGKKNQSLALIASGKHLQSDTWSTVGVVMGLLLIWASGLVWIDNLVALLFGLYIIYTGYKILRSSIAGIMDEADNELLEKMLGLLNKNRRINWIDLHNLRIIKFGNVLHMDCHLTVPWYLNVRDAHLEVDALTGLIRQEFGESVEFFVHIDGCLDFSCKICNKPDCDVRQHQFEHRVEWTIENIFSNNRHHIKS